MGPIVTLINSYKGDGRFFNLKSKLADGFLCRGRSRLRTNKTNVNLFNFFLFLAFFLFLKKVLIKSRHKKILDLIFKLSVSDNLIQTRSNLAKHSSKNVRQLDFEGFHFMFGKKRRRRRSAPPVHRYFNFCNTKRILL